MLVILIMLVLFSACSNPAAYTEDRAAFLSPDSTIENLVKSYNEKDLKAYISSFCDTSHFYDEDIYLWDIRQERRLHKTMFAWASDINLAMQPISRRFVEDDSAQAAYRYQLRLQIPGEQTLIGEGEAELGFLKTKKNTWKIKSFRETKIGLSKNVSIETLPDDSVDYFPLSVGNSWTYEEQFAPGIEDQEVLITDSVMINENLYYQAAGHGYFFIVSASFARRDSLNQLRLYVEDDSTEYIIFNLAAEVGDSLIFIPPFSTEVIVVELISHKDSLTVPAGTFADVLEFLITDFNSGSRQVYEFAANIGLIRQRGTNQVMALKSAFVNGNKFPVITSVENRNVSWTQLKSGFR